MKVVHCPCGKDVEGETDDLLVESVEAHLERDHPDLAGTYSRSEILAMATEIRTEKPAFASGWKVPPGSHRGE